MSYKNTKSQIIARGAEAILTKQDNQLIKHRIKKSYRIQELDEKLRKSRTKKEAKLIEKASQLISVPKIIKISESDRESTTILLEHYCSNEGLLLIQKYNCPNGCSDGVCIQ